MLILIAAGAVVAAPAAFSPWERATEFSRLGPEEAEYLLGLGALQKIRGRWRHKEAETLHGELERITWQVEDGFTAQEGFDWLAQRMPAGAELLFECSGRACGSSAQWASRVFEQRELYGHDDRQRYAVWRLREDDSVWTIVLYAVDRANRRHFLHADFLRQRNPQSVD